MQRHFSDRGEALAEAAAAKMRARRMPIATSSRRRSSVRPGQQKRRVPKIAFPSECKEERRSERAWQPQSRPEL